MNAPATSSPLLIGTSRRESIELLQAQLSSYGFPVQVFGRKSALLAALHAQTAAAVLLDADGLEDGATEDVLPLLRRLFQGPVLCAGTELTVSRQIALMRLGVTGFMSWPVDVQVLIDRLEQLEEAGRHNPYRVLIVDDSETVTRWVSQILQQAGMQVRSLHNPLDIFIALERFRPEIILMDVYMPECGGDEMARLIRQHPQFDSVPIVFLSTETSRGRQWLARSMGGDDFLIKNQESEELLASVVITVERYRRLRHWMTRDGLTGLLDHTHLIQQLEMQISATATQSVPLSYAMIDIDHFKQVNDQHGHAVGDRVIKSLARLLRQMAPSADLIGRYGGEEFAVIFPGLSQIRAAQRVDEMRAAFAALKHLDGGGALQATFSAGVAVLGNNMSAAQLVEAADMALYQAKRAGRNQVGMAS
ncbi:GGDEF domain-containing protein [Chitinilyticum piscinae]|uniref:diguanylate cyclase n=1 Tax=Chitinilyticum piscinae TaxID=2866724 RepID=A0A8J7FLM2_9NEIS|nr:diguanylate cyclase [Chitinilyticum piscinae]MBE9610137.1 diguanylate cyclase [Chitinilyticum piscinae]